MNPKVSIISINLNNSSGLEKTILSVISQTYKNIEYLIIDGGSSDGSLEIIEKYRDKIDFVVSELDNGIYNAINKGIINATGDFLMFMNSGDQIAGIEVVSEIFRENPESVDYDIIYGNTMYSRDDDLIEKIMPAQLSFEFLMEDDINHQSCFVKRVLFDQYGLYDESLSVSADFKFFLQCIINGNSKCMFTNTFIAIYDLNGVSSLNTEVQWRERELVKSQVFPPLVLDLYRDFKTQRAILVKTGAHFVTRIFKRFKIKR